jgi:hypothetical protein
MSKIRLKFIQAFVDRKTGAAFHYFRRAVFPASAFPACPAPSNS